MSPVKLFKDKDLDFPAGYSCGAMSVGIKKGGLDAALLLSEKAMTAEGIFSKNLFEKPMGL